jgi:hypothetical protein
VRLEMQHMQNNYSRYSDVYYCTGKWEIEAGIGTAYRYSPGYSQLIWYFGRCHVPAIYPIQHVSLSVKFPVSNQQQPPSAVSHGGICHIPDVYMSHFDPLPTQILPAYFPILHLTLL